MILLDPNRTLEYVLEAQRPHWKCCDELAERPHKSTCATRGVETSETPVADQFRFSLRVITARRWSRFLAEESEIATAEARLATLADTNLMLLRYGCTGWKGPVGAPAAVLDAEGRLTWESLDLIPPTYRVELADRLWKLNTVYERDVGFSPQP